MFIYAQYVGQHHSTWSEAHQQSVAALDTHSTWSEAHSQVANGAGSLRNCIDTPAVALEGTGDNDDGREIGTCNVIAEGLAQKVLV